MDENKEGKNHQIHFMYFETKIHFIFKNIIIIVSIYLSIILVYILHYTCTYLYYLYSYNNMFIV